MSLNPDDELMLRALRLLSNGRSRVTGETDSAEFERLVRIEVDEARDTLALLLWVSTVGGWLLEQLSAEQAVPAEQILQAARTLALKED